jgi:ABC-type Zn uptake system ZnuABC Zn-binding protein ZnuA
MNPQSTLEGSTDAHSSFSIQPGVTLHRITLRQIPIEVEGQEPSPQELGNIIMKPKQSTVKSFLHNRHQYQTADTIAQK